VANSPALRRGRELKDIDTCLIALGTRLIRSLATCLAIQRLFERDTRMEGVDIADFWMHSLLVGELARGIADSAAYPAPDEAYLAGLLHNIGELVMLNAIGEPYRRFLLNSADNPRLLGEETQLFATTHAEVGGWLIDRWGLDSVLGDSVAFHHAAPAQILTATALPQIIWLAQALVTLPDDTPDVGLVINGASFTVRKADLLTVREQAIERTRQIAEALGMVLPETFPKRRTTLPAQPPAPPVPGNPTEDELTALMGGMALLQPLQQDLFQLGSDKEVLLALQESARILFELSKVAILLANDAGDALSGERVGGQPDLFRQLSIPLLASRSLAAAAVVQRQVRTTFDSPQPLPLLDLQLARALSAEGLLCIPMLTRSRVIGVMICGLSTRQHGRLQKRIPWLANFGKIAAISLDAAQEAERHRQQVAVELTQQFTT